MLIGQKETPVRRRNRIEQVLRIEYDRKRTDMVYGKREAGKTKGDSSYKRKRHSKPTPRRKFTGGMVMGACRN